jgi:hypothetical protein
VLIAAVALRQQPLLCAEAPDAGTIGGNVENKAGNTLEIVDGNKIFSGMVINRGTVKITNSTVTFTNAYTEDGAYLSDPSTTNYTDLNVGSGGYLQGGLGDLFIVSGSFDNGSTQNTLWSTASSELDFGNGSAHQFLLAGVDSGTTIAGYTNNFAWGTVNLYSGQTLSLGAGSGTALYAGALVLGSGTAQISSITGNGHNIYYDSLNPMNNYLGAASYALAGGGSIEPISSLPPTLSGTTGQNITLTADVIGSVTFTYQWYKNSGSIAGATGSSYLISSVTTGSSGTYSVVVSDTAGANTSGTTVLTVSSAVPAMGSWALAALALFLAVAAAPFLRSRHMS